MGSESKKINFDILNLFYCIIFFLNLKLKTHEIIKQAHQANRFQTRFEWVSFTWPLSFNWQGR